MYQKQPGQNISYGVENFSLTKRYYELPRRRQLRYIPSRDFVTIVCARNSPTQEYSTSSYGCRAMYVLRRNSTTYVEKNSAR